MKNSSGKTLTKAEIKRIILTEVPRFIKKDPEIREFILRISSEKFAEKKKTEDRFDRILNHLEKLGTEWNKKWEENQKKWEENQNTIKAVLEEIKLLHRKYDTGIGALGARWGLRAESSFREAIKGIIEEHLPLKVERYRAMDEEGIVFGRPDQIELDLIIRDGMVVVSEIKSSISKADVIIFLKKVNFYEQKEKTVVDKKILISPMIDSAAVEFAQLNGIKVYGYPEEIQISDLQ